MEAYVQKSKEQEAYKHGYSGAYQPNVGVSWRGIAYNRMFSVGLFRWLPKKGGRGLKKSAVVYRIKGPVTRAEEIYRHAAVLCKHLDAGWKPVKKSMTVTKKNEITVP